MTMKETREITTFAIEPRTSFPAIHRFLFLFFLLGTTLSALVSASDLGLTEADCRCCHGATLADRHHLMVIERGFECLKCHQMTWNTTTVQYDVTVTRNCPQCHTGSLADRHHLLVDQVTYNCFTCHTVAWDPDTLMYVAQFNASCAGSSQYPSDNSATINGTVSDTTGNGLAWAQITTDNPDYSALTTDEGAFQLAKVPQGDYLLTASADGYVSTGKRVTVAENQVLNVDLVLSPLGASPTITGLVLDSTRTPIEGAHIYSDDGLYSTLSDGDGSFALVSQALGDITLRAEKGGLGSVAQSLSLVAGLNQTIEFVLPDMPLEVCSDGVDNDSNGQADCDDAACAGTAACRNPMEICGDGLDNDANGLVDCGDLACRGSVGCSQPSGEICRDGIDNDNNSLVDCDDPACTASAYCLTENCNDGIDNNGDGMIDCADSVCASTSKCLAPPVEICDDGLDNDGDGRFDCADDKCSSKPTCLQPGGGANPAGGACEYIVQSEWARGFTAVIRINNRGSTPINGWNVNWEYTDGSTIRSIWNADTSGANPYTASSLNWNAVIYPGKSVEIGLLGDKSLPPAAQVPMLTGPVCNANSDVKCDYIVHGEWDDGFNAAIRLYNGGSVPLRGWVVDWAYTDGSSINQIWNASLSGSNPYQATNLGWNRIINPGTSVNFGMIGHKQEVHAQVPIVSGDICNALQ